MKKIFTTAVLSFCVSVIYSQRSTHIGVELGLADDIYRISEMQSPHLKSNVSQLKTSPYKSGIVGLNIRRDLSSTFYLETGLHLKTYAMERNFDFDDRYFTSGTSNHNSFRSFLIPVKVGAKVNLYKDKIHLTPNIGFAFVKNHFPKLNPNINQGEGIYTYPNGSNLQYSYSTHFNANSYVLAQAGMGLDVKLTRGITLSLAGSSYHGFKKAISQDIQYSVDNNPARSAQCYSNGNMRVLSLGLKFTIGAKKKQ
jgi:hypothetical protein